MTELELKNKFVEVYGGNLNDIRIFSAAGRVNLIGEHIDYCKGAVLPAALNLRCMVAARKTVGNQIKLAATTIDKTAMLEIDKLNDYRDLAWGEYQAGVAYIMQSAGYKVVPMQLLYDCNVPFGSGLSSSAAIEVATAITISTFSLEAGGKEASLKELAVLSQKAENEYAMVNCGIMDQFASSMGKKDCAIYLNCNTLEYKYIPLKLKDCGLVIINSNKKRSLQDSKYNERRLECEEALKLLQTRIDGIDCLADVSIEMFENNKDILSGKVQDRAEHVVYECDRVEKSLKALQNGNVEEFGKLLNESHFSLSMKYEVAGAELDALTDISRNQKGCLGSRMTGAGFGGCTVSIVRKVDIENFKKNVVKLYKERTSLIAEVYETTIEDGAFEVK